MRRDFVIPEVPAWHKDAVCTNHEPELWFPVSVRQAWLPVNICNNECPVRAECLKWALDKQVKYGVWGGKTEQQRERMLRSAS